MELIGFVNKRKCNVLKVRQSAPTNVNSWEGGRGGRCGTFEIIRVVDLNIQSTSNLICDKTFLTHSKVNQFRSCFEDRLTVLFLLLKIRNFLFKYSFYMLERELVKTSDVIDLTISDHFLVFAVLNLKQPKASPSYVITRSFKNYSSEKIVNDISTIPWDVLDLLPTVDEKLDAFNDLFLTCLDKHAPVKKIRIKHRACPFMIDDIKQLIITRNSLHRSARRFGSPNKWKAFSEKKRQVRLAIKSAEIAY